MKHMRKSVSARKEYLDIAKLFAIFFVVLDHAQYYMPSSPKFQIYRVAWKMIALPIFFITLALPKDPSPVRGWDGWRRQLVKLFRAILVPYLLWAFFLDYGGVTGKMLSGILYGTNTSLSTASTDSIIWFLPVLFWAKVFLQLYVNVTARLKKPLWTVVTAAAVLILAAASFYWGAASGNHVIFGIDIALMGTALALMGWLIKPLLEKLLFRAGVLLQILVFLLCTAAALVLAFVDMPPFYQADGSVAYKYAIWIARGTYGRHFLLFLLGCLTGCGAVLIASQWLSPIRFLSLCGRNTLGIMVLHGILYNLVTGPVFTTLITNEAWFRGLRSCATCTVAAGATLLLCMPVALAFKAMCPPLFGSYTPAPKKEG